MAASFQNLPLELLYEIIEYLDTSSLLALFLVSSQLATCSRKYLYASVDLRYRHKHAKTLFLETLLRQPSYGKLVKLASFGLSTVDTSNKSELPQLPPAPQRWLEMLSNHVVKIKPSGRSSQASLDSDRSASALAFQRSLLHPTILHHEDATVAIALMLLPNVRKLRIRTPTPQAILIVETVLSQYCIQRSLHSHSTCASSATRNQFGLLETISIDHYFKSEGHFPWQLFPNLKRFYCRKLSFDSRVSHKPTQVERPRSDNLTLLHLLELQVMDYEKSTGLLPYAPKLRHLVLEAMFMSDLRWSPLTAYSEHIETLVWNDNAGCIPWASQRCFEFNKAPRLKKLLVTARALLPESSDSIKIPPLSSLLPENLEVLWIHNVYFSCFEGDTRMNQHLRSLVVSPHKSLKYILLSEPVRLSMSYSTLEAWNITQYGDQLKRLKRDLAAVGVTLMWVEHHMPRKGDFVWPV